jgi:hypothetical protein
MAKNHRPPRTEVVEIPVAIGVPKISALGADEEWRRAPNGAKGAHRRVDPAGQEPFGAALKLERF